jgi:hypothetical protein
MACPFSEEPNMSSNVGIRTGSKSLARLVIAVLMALVGMVALLPPTPAAAAETLEAPISDNTGFANYTSGDGTVYHPARILKAAAKDQDGNPILLFEDRYDSPSTVVLGAPTAVALRTFRLLRCNDPLCAGGDDTPAAGFAPPGTPGSREYLDYEPIDIAARPNGRPVVLARTTYDGFQPSWALPRWNMELVDCADAGCINRTANAMEKPPTQRFCEDASLAVATGCPLTPPGHWRTGKLKVGADGFPRIVLISSNHAGAGTGAYKHEIWYLPCDNAACTENYIGVSGPGVRTRKATPVNGGFAYSPFQFATQGFSSAETTSVDPVDFDFDLVGPDLPILTYRSLERDLATGYATRVTSCTGSYPAGQSQFASFPCMFASTAIDSAAAANAHFVLTGVGLHSAVLVRSTLDGLQVLDCGTNPSCGGSGDGPRPVSGTSRTIPTLSLTGRSSTPRVLGAEVDADGRLGIMLEGNIVVRCADAYCSDSQDTTVTTPYHPGTVAPGEVQLAEGTEVVRTWLRPDGKPQFAFSSAGTVGDILGDVNLGNCDDKSCFPDALAVSVEQAAGQLDPAPTAPINFTVEFNAPVSAFAGDDVVIGGTSGATTATVTGGPRVYNVAISGMTGDGLVTAKVPANAVTGPLSLTNAASKSIDNQVDYGRDTTAPTGTINQAAGQSDPAGGSSLTFTAVLSEPVTGLTTSDIVLSGTSTGAYVAAIYGDGTTYTVQVGCGPCTDGTIIANLPAGAVTDLAGLSNTAATYDDNEVQYDGGGPSISIDLNVGQPQVTATAPVKFRVSFSEPINFSQFAFNSIFMFPGEGGGDGYGGDAGISGTAFNNSFSGAKGTPVVTVTQLDPTHAIISVTGMIIAGTVVLNIPAFSANDLLGNGNDSPAIVAHNIVQYWPEYPTATVVLKPGQTQPFDGSNPDGKLTYVVTTSEPVMATAENDPYYFPLPVGQPSAYGFGIAPPPAVTADSTGGYTIRKLSSTKFEIDFDSFTVSGIHHVQVGNQPPSMVPDPSGGGGFGGPGGQGEAPNIYVNSAGKRLLLSNIATAVIDASPTVRVLRDPSNPYVSYQRPAVFDLVLSEETVDDLAIGDIQLEATDPVTGDALPATGLVLQNLTKVNATTYRVEVSGMTADMVLTVKVDSDSVTDVQGLTNLASGSALPPLDTSDDHVYFKFDNTAPVVTVEKAVGQADPTKTSPIVFTITTSEPVYGFDSSDVVVTSTAGPVTSVLSGVQSPYTLTVTGMNQTGDVSAQVRAGAVQDLAGNVSAIATSTDNTVAYDLTRPSAEVDYAEGQSATGAGPVRFTVAFSEPVTGFVAGDVVLGGRAGATTATIVSGSSGSRFYTVEITGMTDAGTVTLTVPENVAADLAGNLNTAATTVHNSVNWVSKPSVMIYKATTQADPTNGSPVVFTAVFSSDVTGFTAADVTLGGTAGATTAVVTGGPATYTIAVSGMTGDGTVTASIPADSALAGTSGNTVSTSTDNSVSYDTTRPKVTVEQSALMSDPSKVNPKFTVTFSEPVTGFTGSDVTLGGTAGATTAAVTGGPTVYTVTVSGMTDDGTVIASVPSNVAVDTAANQNKASTSTDNAVTYDATPPTAVITLASGQAAAAHDSPVVFTVTFSEPVTGFTAADVTLSGTAGATTAVVTGGPTVYTVTVSSMTGNGTVVLAVPAAGAQDAADNLNTAATGTGNTVTFDTVRPTVTINQASGQADPTKTSPVNFTVIFSESVTGFTAADVTLSGTVGATTATVTGIGATYSIAVSGMTGTGTVVATLAADSATDAAANTSLASSSTDNSVTYDITRSTVTVEQASTQSDPTNGSSIVFTATFSEPVTDFAATDVTFGGTAGAATAVVTGGPTVYTVTVSGLTGDGTVTASVPANSAADAAGNQNTASASTDNSVTYDATRPSVTIAQVATVEPSTDSPVKFTVTFFEPITGFTSTDVTVGGTAGARTAVVTGGPTVFTVSVYGMTQDGTVTIAVPEASASDPAGNTNKAGTGDGSVDYKYVADTTAPEATVALDPLQALVAQDGPVVFTLSFSEPVVGLEVADLVVTGTATTGTPTITGTGPIYTVSIPVDSAAEGTVTLGLVASAVQDLAGNSNPASASGTVTIDRTVPTASALAVEPAPGSPPTTAMFTVTFSEPVTGFESSDVTVGGTAQPTTATVTGSEALYQVAVTGMDRNGTVTIDVPAGAAGDRSGRLSLPVKAFRTFSGILIDPVFDTTKFVPLKPIRFFDTRANGSAGPKGLIPAGQSIDVQVAGEFGIPADAVAVVFNLTATDSVANGYITAWPTGEPRPNTSNLNLTAGGQTRPNLATVKLGAGGKVSFYSFGGTHLLGDATGYFVRVKTAPTDGRLVAITPVRLLDTRPNGIGPKGYVSAGSTISVQITGRSPLPASGISAVVMSITATTAGGPGFVTVWPSGTEMPIASSLNLNDSAEAASNLVIVPVGADGKIDLFAFAGAHLIGDVVGYFTDATAAASMTGLFVAQSPSRLFDTRPNNETGPKGLLRPDSTIEAEVKGHAGVPLDGVGAVLANVTGDLSTGTGHVITWPGGPRPNTTTLSMNGVRDQRASMTIMGLTSSTVELYSYGGTHLLADVFGWFTS